MSTMSLIAPLAVPRRNPTPRSSPVAHPAATVLRGHVGRADRGHTCVQPTSAAPPLRLTSRGRLVLLVAVLVMAFSLSLVTQAVSLPSISTAVVPVRYVSVDAGQTLWEIAGEVAPRADRRDTVAQIVELNSLPDSGVRAGQQIAVPVGG